MVSRKEIHHFDWEDVSNSLRLLEGYLPTWFSPCHAGRQRTGELEKMGTLELMEIYSMECSAGDIAS